MHSKNFYPAYVICKKAQRIVTERNNLLQESKYIKSNFRRVDKKIFIKWRNLKSVWLDGRESEADNFPIDLELPRLQICAGCRKENVSSAIEIGFNFQTFFYCTIVASSLKRSNQYKKIITLWLASKLLKQKEFNFCFSFVTLYDFDVLYETT